MEKIITPSRMKRKPRNCPEHGDYESCSMDPKFWTPCPVCQDRQEAERIQAKMAQNRIESFQSMLRFAGLGKRFLDKSFANYLPRSANQRQILAVVTDYAANFPANLDAGRCLGLIGDAGNGKTHLGVAILREVITAGYKGRYVRAYDLFKAIKESWNSIGAKRGESEAAADFTKPDLLVLDEVGVQFNTDTERTLLFQVIDTRYNDSLPTVVISNLPKPAADKQRDLAGNDWEPRRNPKDLEDAMGFRSYDRLTENGGQILVFKGESFRRNPNPDQITAPAAGLQETSWQA